MEIVSWAFSVLYLFYSISNFSIMGVQRRFSIYFSAFSFRNRGNHPIIVIVGKESGHQSQFSVTTEAPFSLFQRDLSLQCFLHSYSHLLISYY